MKKSLLIAAGLLAVVQTQAQTPRRHFTREDNKLHSLIRSIVRSQLPVTAQKPTAIKQRVVAQGTTYFEEGNVYRDSLTFAYSGSNGSRYNHNNVGYNESFEPEYAPMYSDYRYSVSPLDLLADSISYYDEGMLSDVERAWYRSDKKIDSVHTINYEMGNPELSNRTLTRYSPGGYLLQQVTLEPVLGGDWDTLSYRNTAYNNDFTRVLADTSAYMPGAGFFFGNSRYSYNTAGRIDTVYANGTLLGEESKTRMLLDYYTDGKLRKAVQQTFTGGAWQNTQIDSLGYSSNGAYINYWLQMPYEGGVTDPDWHMLTRHFEGANGYPDSVLQYNRITGTSGWAPVVRWNYTYNEYDNPVTFTSTTIADGLEEMDGYINFYYELYDDQTSVKPVSAAADFSIYPNPFSNKINISWKGKPQSRVAVRLINVTGQEVYRSVMQLNAGSNNLDVPGLRSGNYILLLQDEQGKTWSSKLVKQ